MEDAEVVAVAAVDVSSELHSDIAELEAQIDAIANPLGAPMQQVKTLMVERVDQLRAQRQERQAQLAAEKGRTPFEKLQTIQWAIKKNDERRARAGEGFDADNVALRWAEDSA